MLNKAKSDELDIGERESIMDALKADLVFCHMYED